MTNQEPDPSPAVLLAQIEALCARAGFPLVGVADPAPAPAPVPVRHRGLADPRPCVAVWFASFQDAIEFQELQDYVRDEFGCDWRTYGAYGWRGMLLQFGFGSEFGVYGRAIPVDDLPDVVVGLTRLLADIEEDGSGKHVASRWWAARKAVTR